MPKHFRWILSCAEDGTTYQLQNDPIGFDECTYRMERHGVYHGIFNQFTSNLRFHNDGGGKQYIDLKYVLYDINARIDIEVQVDIDGNGNRYETLFKGKLNMASYQDDGLHTSVNIEQSDLAAKLNTRADIPVPINVPEVNLPGQETLRVIIVGEYQPEDSTSGSYTFADTGITKGRIYKVITTDINNDEVVDTITYTTEHQTGTGGAIGPTSLQISDVTDGLLTVSFANIYSPVLLVQIGPQLSLGQQALQPVETHRVNLEGIPLLYETDLKMVGDVNSDTYELENEAILPEHTYTVITADANSWQVSDTVVYTGTSTTGTGATSAGTTIRITAITDGSITVAYKNAYGSIDLWIDGVPLDSYTPAAEATRQEFHKTDVSFNAPNEKYQGFMAWNTDTLFDNMNQFTFGSYFDVAVNNVPGSAVSTENTGLPPIFTGVNQPWIKYPLQVEYNINLLGTLTDAIDNGDTSVSRSRRGSIVLAYGKTLADSTQIILWTFEELTSSAASYEQEFDINSTDIPEATGTLQLNAGEQVWLYCFFATQFLAGDGGSPVHSIDLSWAFEKSNLNFRITENALPSVVSGILIHEAFTQVADVIADSDGNFYSELYGRTHSAKRSYPQNGEASFRMITNGLCVRGKKDKYISTSLNELFTSMAAIDNIGMEIDANNRLRVEKLEHFFDRETKIATLPKVYSYTTLNENSLYYNQAEVGYAKWETEIYFKNGMDEVHGKRFYGTKIATAKGSLLPNYSSQVKSLVAVSNKLEKVSNLVAGNYAIELTRRKNFEWAQDDFKYDTDNFIICLDNRWKGLQFVKVLPAAGNSGITLVGDHSSIKAGDTLTISGSAYYNGAFTVVSVEYKPVLNLTVINLGETFSSLYYDADAVVSYPQPIFAERVDMVLDGPIANIYRPEQATGWLNMSITPARMLQNNMNHLTAGLQKIKGNIQFLNGEGNYLATTKLKDNGTTRQQDYTNYQLAENASLSYADNNVRNITPLWVPEVYRFEYPLTYQQFKAIRANPNGYIEFYKFEGQVKKGFILSMEYQLKTGMTKFELLKVYDPLILLLETEYATLAADEEGHLLQQLMQLG